MVSLDDVINNLRHIINAISIINPPMYNANPFACINVSNHDSTVVPIESAGYMLGVNMPYIINAIIISKYIDNIIDVIVLVFLFLFITSPQILKFCINTFYDHDFLF